MASEAIAALQSATTEAERRAALVQAMPYNTEAHPDVQQAFQTVRQRQHRMGLLVANFTALPVNPTRQSSHRERMGFLMEAQTRRSLGLDDSILKRAMKDTCKSFRCPDCDAEGASYKSTCLQFMLNCLGVRIQTRLHYDKENGYRIDPVLTNVMERFVANPVGFWLDEHAQFVTLPDALDLMYVTVVSGTAVDEESRREAKHYNKHAEAIRKVVESIGRCEQSSEASSSGTAA